MSAGVTTTHDKYPPFTRAELQQLRDRAQWIGANLIDGNAAHSHLDIAQAADHLDAILARTESKPDLKLYVPPADTFLYDPAAPSGFAGFDAAAPAPDGEPESDGARAEREAARLSAHPQSLRDALADQRIAGWVAVPEAPDDSDGVFQRLASRVRGRVVDRIARRHGARHAAVEAALQEATRDRPLWQWLRDGGLERLIALVVSLLPLFV